MSAVGTIPLQSPGCNEGKARNETLGTHRQKQMSSDKERHNNTSICFTSWKCRPFGAQDMLIDY